MMGDCGYDKMYMQSTKRGKANNQKNEHFNVINDTLYMH